MKQFITLFAIFLGLSGILILTGCGSGSGYSSGHQSVYYGYGYHHDHYDDDDDNYNKPDRPDRPERPDRPTRPIVRPKPGGPSIQPVNRPKSARMGRPSGRSGGRRR